MVESHLGRQVTNTWNRKNQGYSVTSRAYRREECAALVPWRSLLVGLHILGAAQVEQSAQECRHCCRKQGVLESNTLQPSASGGISPSCAEVKLCDGWKVASKRCLLPTRPSLRVKRLLSHTSTQTHTHMHTTHKHTNTQKHICTHLVIAMPLQRIGNGPCKVRTERIAQQMRGQDVDRACRCTLRRSQGGQTCTIK